MTTDTVQAPREIDAKRKAFAFETACGYPPAEACRRAGGKVENGHATKWLAQKRVQEWIAYYRKLGNTDEMLAAKKARIEERLNLAAFGNIFDFADCDAERGPQIDWSKVADSPYGVIISGFKFDKDTGRLSDFERDNALQALAQLRDMHGFKSVTKTALTDPTGEKSASLYLISDKPMTEAQWEAERASATEA